MKPELHCNWASGPQTDKTSEVIRVIHEKGWSKECVPVARGLEKTVYTEEGVEAERDVPVSLLILRVSA